MLLKHVVLGALALGLVAGCGHRGEVKDMILSKYASMSEGGKISFVTYEESHTTEWNVRTFRAKGTVKWKKPWYLVVKTFPPRYGISELVLVKPYAELNEGADFKAVFYRGNTDKKPEVTVYLKEGAKYTEEGLLRKYPSGVFVLEDGKCLKRDLDKKKFAKAYESSMSRIDQKIKSIEHAREEIRIRVENYLAVSFSDLNEKSLDDYIKSGGDLCVEIGRPISDSGEILQAHEYFETFPIVGKGQDAAKELAEKLRSAIQATKDVLCKVEARYDAARGESSSRVRRGVRFLKGVPRQTGKRDRITSVRVFDGAVQVSDVEECGPSGVASIVGDETSLDKGKTIKMGVGEIVVTDVGENDADPESTSAAPSGSNGRRRIRRPGASRQTLQKNPSRPVPQTAPIPLPVPNPAPMPASSPASSYPTPIKVAP